MIRDLDKVEEIVLPGHQILPLKMLCGPYNDAYIVTLSDNDYYHIYCISLTQDHTYSVASVFNTYSEIKAVQIHNHDKLDK